MCSTRQRTLSLLIVPAYLLIASCSLKDRARNFLRGDEHGTVAVRVGDRGYTNADLDRFFDSRLSEFRDPANGDRVKSNLLDSFIEDRLLLYEAERLRIQPNEQLLKGMLEKISNSEADAQGDRRPERLQELELGLVESLKMQQYLHDHVLKDVKVADQECEAYYKAHLGEYVRNDMVHVREILIDDMAQAEKILSLLVAKRNRNFAELARLYSKGASASDGGDLGVFQRGDLPEDFEKAVFPLSPGTISKIVRSKYGYHLFLVEEKILAHQQKLYEVIDAIRERLQLEREREIMDQELSSLRGRIPVEIHRERLGFNYAGFPSPSEEHR